MTFRIKTVAEMTGVPRATLLAWERRYAVPSPSRSASGYRDYSDQDVAVLKRLKALVDAGHPISEAVAILRGGAPASVDPVAEVLHALLRFDRGTADRMLVEWMAGPSEAAIDGLYLPVLHRIGDLWVRGEATVAQEHFVSGWVREQLLALFHALGGGPEGGPTVACALPPQEQHELGMLAVAVKLALRGWRVTWLGAQLPLPDLCTFLAREAPRVLCLGFVVAKRTEVVSYAEEVRRCALPRTLVVIGGPGADGLDARSTPVLVYAATWEALVRRLGGRP